MNLLVLALSILLGISVLAANNQVTQIDYNNCIREGYYAQNIGPNSCDFSNAIININIITRECNMAAFESIPLDDLSGFNAKIDKLQANAFVALNKDLNSKLYDCGFMGEIELNANNRGRIQILKFTVTPESCGMLDELIASNKEESESADLKRQKELNDLNHRLIRIRQGSSC